MCYDFGVLPISEVCHAKGENDLKYLVIVVDRGVKIAR